MLAISESTGLPTLVAWAHGEYDVMVLDSPPAALASDALLLSAVVDGVVFVARASVTPGEAVAMTIQEFRSASAPVLGTVLNDVRPHRDAGVDAAGHGHGYERFVPVGAQVGPHP